MTYVAHHKRLNFPKDIRRAALERSGGYCECVGPDYGLPLGKRCNAPLSKGIHFEHIIADSIGGKPHLTNCLASCPKCNLYKADHIDKPRAAKVKRQSDKHHGILSSKAHIANRGFAKTSLKSREPGPKETQIRMLKNRIDGTVIRHIKWINNNSSPC